MGRKRADVWSEFEESEKGNSYKAKRVKCIHCGREFTAHANRMKEHLRDCEEYKDALFKGNARQIDLNTQQQDNMPLNYQDVMYSPIMVPELVNKSFYRMGIVGGNGQNTMASLHISAAMLSRRSRLVCGCFSSDPQKSKQCGILNGLPQGRIYKDYDTMFKKEMQLPPSERMNFVCIATPTGTHYSIAMEALQSGFHVMCEAPVCLLEEEAMKLYNIAAEKGLVFGVSYPYCCYRMIRYARDIITNGAIGDIISIRVSYLQNKGILDTDAHSWKQNPAIAGLSYCFSDLGLQAYQLVRFLTQMTPNRISACLARSYSNRQMDDNGMALIQMKEGAFCHMTVSKMSLIHDNDIRIEIDGIAGGVEWSLSHPNQLVYQRCQLNKQVLTPDSPVLSEQVNTQYPRMHYGYTESYNEAMATMYELFFTELDYANQKILTYKMDYPSIIDGIEGVVFLNRAVESSQRGSLWTDIPLPPQLYDNTGSTPIPPYSGVSSMPNNGISGNYVNPMPVMNNGASYPIMGPMSSMNSMGIPMSMVGAGMDDPLTVNPPPSLMEQNLV